MIAEVERLATPATDEVGELQPGHSASPGEEAPLGVELLEFHPQDEGGLLIEIVGVIPVVDQGMDVPKQSGAVLTEILHELGLARLHVLPVHRRHPCTSHSS